MEQRIGNYTIVRELARGGMGVVFVARQEGLEREVALKLHLGAGQGDADDAGRDARARERFDREAMAVARLRHPHVIQVHEFGHHRGVPFLVMDLIEGESLECRIEREGALDPAEAIRILTPVVEAVSHAHAEGILHRDLKPANILLSKEGRPYLTDFGLARDLSDARDRLTRSGQLLGTPFYMAPEAASGATDAIDARSDVYSLGAVLFQLLTGEPAFTGDSLIALLRSIVSDPATPPSQIHPGVPSQLDAIVLQCLEKEPERRYAHAQELADDLERFAQGEPVSASRSSLALGRSLRKITSSKAWLIVPLALALGVLGLVVDRAWLAPARAAQARLQGELDWQRKELRPTLYGLDPRHPLELSAGDLRKRLDEVELLPEDLGSERVEARAYLAAYVWLLQRSKGRRRPSAGALSRVSGRPDVAVRAVALAEEGDFAGAQRLLAEALPDAPELRSTELALLARHEPLRFLESGPSEEGTNELKQALLPQALREHFEELLGDGLSGGQSEFSQRLARGSDLVARWGEPGATAARQALEITLEAKAPRYAALHEVDPPVALERLDRLRLCWQKVPGCQVPEELQGALLSSLAPCLALALSGGATGRDATRVFELELCLEVFSGERHEAKRIRQLAVLYVAKAGRGPGNAWKPGPRSLLAALRNTADEPERMLTWVRATLTEDPTIVEAFRSLYPSSPFSPFLPAFSPQVSFRAKDLAASSAPAPGIAPTLLWVLRHLVGRKLAEVKVGSGRKRADSLGALSATVEAMRANQPEGIGRRWLLLDLEWCLAQLKGESGGAEKAAFSEHLVQVRRTQGLEKAGSTQLARALIRLALISGQAEGEPLLEEALEISGVWAREAERVRSSWR